MIFIMECIQICIILSICSREANIKWYNIFILFAKISILKNIYNCLTLEKYSTISKLWCPTSRGGFGSLPHIRQLPDNLKLHKKHGNKWCESEYVCYIVWLLERLTGINIYMEGEQPKIATWLVPLSANRPITFLCGRASLSIQFMSPKEAIIHVYPYWSVPKYWCFHNSAFR